MKVFNCFRILLWLPSGSIPYWAWPNSPAPATVQYFTADDVMIRANPASAACTSEAPSTTESDGKVGPLG